MWYPILLTVLASYFLGNLNGAVNISMLLSNDDVRSHGSGNAGLTNFIRNFGSGNAGWVLLVDVGKTVLSCLLGGLLLKPYGCETEGRMLGAVAVTLGHDFPVLLGLRGGKGIVCGAAAAVVIDPLAALILAVIFFSCYFITHYVSLGSVLSAVAFALYFGVRYYQQIWVCLGGIFLGLLAVWLHRTNIERLCKGTERKSSLFGKGK